MRHVTDKEYFKKKKVEALYLGKNCKTKKTGNIAKLCKTYLTRYSDHACIQSFEEFYKGLNRLKLIKQYYFIKIFSLNKHT